MPASQRSTEARGTGLRVVLMAMLATTPQFVEYNAHVIRNILTYIAPPLGWR